MGWLAMGAWLLRESHLLEPVPDWWIADGFEAVNYGKTDESMQFIGWCFLSCATITGISVLLLVKFRPWRTDRSSPCPRKAAGVE